MTAAIATKLCRACHADIPREEFMARASNSDGLYSYCRPCDGAKQKASRDARPGWKEYKREYDRARVAELKDKLSTQGRARYERTRPQAIERAKDWAQQNPEKRRAIAQSYKHRRRSVERAGMTGRELAAWKSAQSKVCHWCDAPCERGFVVDHVQPLSKGGKHEATNLVIACRPCNARKAARDPIEFAQSLKERPR